MSTSTRYARKRPLNGSVARQHSGGVGQEIVYPSSDGKPMSESTLHYEWIVKCVENLRLLFIDRSDVFVAGDLLWYPVEGRPDIRQAPDAMVAFGTASGGRSSYLQWKENNIAPQVVFEIRSPSNTNAQLKKKLAFYDRYGPEEYYLYDPQKNVFKAWTRQEGTLKPVEVLPVWKSPLLNVQFEWTPTTLVIKNEDGFEWQAPSSWQQNYEREKVVAAEARAKEAEARAQAEEERARFKAERAKNQAAESRILELERRLKALEQDLG